MFRGESVIIRRPVFTSYDANRDPVYTWQEEPLDNVLFGRPSSDQIEEAMRLYSVRCQYTLGIPKSYEASLRGCKVYRLRSGIEYAIAGDPQPLPNELCPTSWNREALAGYVDG